MGRHDDLLDVLRNVENVLYYDDYERKVYAAAPYLAKHLSCVSVAHDPCAHNNNQRRNITIISWSGRSLWDESAEFVITDRGKWQPNRPNHYPVPISTGKAARDEILYSADALDRPRNQFEIFLRRPAGLGRRQIRTKLPPPRHGDASSKTGNVARKATAPTVRRRLDTLTRGAGRAHDPRTCVWVTSVCEHVCSRVLYSSDEPSS